MIDIQDKLKEVSIADKRRLDALNDMVRTKGVNKRQSLLKSGYKLSYANNPKQFLNAKKTKALISWIDYELEEISKRMNTTRNKAKYKELADSFVNLKKLSQLIGGNATERIELAPAQKQEIDDIFDNQD